MTLKRRLVEYFRGTHAMQLCRDELMQTQFLSRKELQHLQWERLQELLRHAYDHVPYYHRLFTEQGLEPTDIHSLSDLQLLPALTKENIRAHHKELVADNARQFRPRPVSSGGSTGEPLTFYIDSLTNSYQWADVYRGQLIGGWVPGEHMAKIYGSSVLSVQNPFKQKVYARLNNWHMFPAFDAGDEQMRKWIDLLRRNRIRTLGGYVDTMVDFARFVVDQGLHTHLVAVFPTTAPLTPSGRRILERAFGCGVFDLYQSADGGISAIECQQHRGLHVAEERCLLEAPQGPGEHELTAVVTDLFNYAMPFIRYENGDELAVTNELCPCGRESLLICRVRGKTYHHILLPNGQRVHSEVFAYHLRNFLMIKHFCAIQTSPNDIALELLVDERYRSEKPRVEDALALLPNSLPGMRVRVKYVGHIKKLPSQKYQSFVPYDVENQDSQLNGTAPEL